VAGGRDTEEPWEEVPGTGAPVECSSAGGPDEIASWKDVSKG